MPALTLDCNVRGKNVFVQSGGFIGGRVVVFPLIDSGCQEFLHPLVQKGTALEEIEGLPASKDTPICGVQTLSNGNSLLVWNECGYEFDPVANLSKPLAVWPLQCKSSFVDFSAAPAANNGIFYISGRHLFEIHKDDKKPAAHLKSIGNMLSVGPGPEGAVIIRLGDNSNDDLGLIYFTQEGKIIHIQRDVFKDMEYGAQGLFWSATAKKLFALSYNKIFSADGDSVLRLPHEAAP